MADAEPAGGGALDGVRVLEVGTLIAGPFAGRMLGDLGADVIKIEPPGRPDPLREWGVVAHRDRKLWWPVQSRNKRLITLNLREPQGQQVFRRLAAEADVVIENFRPGTMERWDLAPESLLEVNPHLIVTRVSGFGQTGPYSRRAGFGAVAEAMAGLRHLSGFPGGPPPRTGLALGDTVAAMIAAFGIVSALWHRDRTEGQPGQVIDVSLLESVFALLDSVAPEYSATGAVRHPSGTTLPGIAPSNIYRTADDKWILIASNSDALFARLAAVMERPELVTDPRFATHHARGDHQAEIDEIVADWVRARPAAEIDRLLEQAGVVCGPVNTIADIFSDPHVAARQMLVEHHDELAGSFAGPAPVPRFSHTPASVRWSGGATPGQDNATVFGELLGLDDGALADLARAGVI